MCLIVLVFSVVFSCSIVRFKKSEQCCFFSPLKVVYPWRHIDVWKSGTVVDWVTGENKIIISTKQRGQTAIEC